MYYMFSSARSFPLERVARGADCRSAHLTKGGIVLYKLRADKSAKQSGPGNPVPITAVGKVMRAGHPSRRLRRRPFIQ